jgi:hypothetical protein
MEKENELIAYSKERLVNVCKDYFSENDFPEAVRNITALLNSHLAQASENDCTIKEVAATVHSVTYVIALLIRISDEVDFLNRKEGDNDTK